MLNIVVTRSDGRAPPLLCNYLTTPQMVRYTLWPRCTMSSPTNSERVVQVVYSASLASCSIPGVYDAVELMAKDRHGALVPYFKTGGHRWLDGGAGSQLTWQVALHATCREQARQKGSRKAPRRRLFTPRAVSRYDRKVPGRLQEGASSRATCREQVRQKGSRKAPRRRLFTPRAVSRYDRKAPGRLQEGASSRHVP